MTIFIWRAIYISNGYEVIKGYTFETMIMYIIMNNFSSILFSFEYCFRLGQMIKSGKLTTILLRPISILGEGFSYYLGNKLIYIIIYIIVFITMCLQLKGSQINYLIACLLLVIINVRMFFMLLSFISTLGFRFIQMWYLNIIQCGYQMLFSSAHESLCEKIIEGELDYIFVRPVNSFFYYIFYRVDLPSAINLTIAIIVQVIIMSKKSYSILQMIGFVLFILLGIWFLFLLNQIVVMVSFWKEKSSKLMGMPEYFVDASTRPKDMYPNAIKYLLIWIIPIFTTINGPVDILKNDYNMVAFLWYFIYLVVFSFITYWLWLKGLKRYLSAN